MKCAICGKEIIDFGNNPWPIRTSENARCCDDCNSTFVVTVRIMTMNADIERIETIANKLNELSEKELRKLFTR